MKDQTQIHTSSPLRRTSLGIAGTLSALVLPLATPAVSPAQSPSMAKLAAATSSSGSLDSFLKNFDYEAYLKGVALTDFETLQKDRLFVYRSFGEGDAFLFHLGQNFINHYPVGATLAELSAKTDIGAAFLGASGAGIHSRNRDVYEIIGYYVLGQVSSRMSAEIAAGKLDPDAAESDALIKRLAGHKVHVAFERGFLSKLVHNAQNGKWEYIIDRIQNKVNSLVQGAPSGPAQPAPGAQRFQGPPAIQLKPFRSFYPVGKGEVKMSSFIANDRASGTQLGQVVFLRRPSAKAGYLAADVPARLGQIRGVMTVMTGGFTNNYQKPEGLTIDRGQVINAVLMHDRDALVMVEKNGGVRVINLDRPDITLPGAGKITNPRNDLVAFSQLLRWCQQTGATTFQTQLLAFGDELRIDPAKASTTQAERRLLALTSHKKTGEVTHVVFNIRQPHSLAGLAEKAFHILAARNLKVEAMLNLDTGGQDVMEVYDEKHQAVPEIKGRLAIHQTTNLLVYSN